MKDLLRIFGKKNTWLRAEKFRFVASTICILVIASQAGQAQESSSLKDFGFSLGWGKGWLEKEADNYQIVNLNLCFGFDVGTKFQKLKLPDTIKLVIEPFVSSVLNPDSNLEMGCGLLLKYTYPLNAHFSPYLETGTGAIYTTQRLEEQSTSWNFLTQCGCGVHYFFREATSLDIGYRLRHFSNAGIKKPNQGVNIHCLLLGLSFHC